MSRRSRVTSALVLATACSTGMLAFQPLAQAASIPSGQLDRPTGPGAGARGGTAGKDTTGVFDIREGTTPAQQKAHANRSAALEAAAPVRKLAKALGPQSVIDVDPLTGTPRQVSRLDGMLTGPSRASAKSVALGYVRAHADVFGLSATDLAQLELARDYVDIAGIHHLAFVQKVDGVPLFGNGLEANVTKDGRLINVTGSPVPGLHAPASLRASLSVDAAIRVSKKDMGEKQVAPAKGDTGKPVLFHTAGGTRRAHPDRHDVRRHTDAGRHRRRVRADPLPRRAQLGADGQRHERRRRRPARPSPLVLPPARTRPTSSTTTPAPLAAAAGRTPSA